MGGLSPEVIRNRHCVHARTHECGCTQTHTKKKNTTHTHNTHTQHTHTHTHNTHTTKTHTQHTQHTPNVENSRFCCERLPGLLKRCFYNVQARLDARTEYIYIYTRRPIIYYDNNDNNNNNNNKNVQVRLDAGQRAASGGAEARLEARLRGMV
jgi:hypothetical protein